MVHLIVRRRLRADYTVKVGALARVKKRESHRSGQYTKRRQRTRSAPPRGMLRAVSGDIDSRRLANRVKLDIKTEAFFTQWLKSKSSALQLHAPPKAAPHGFFSAHTPKCADASTTAQIPSESFAETSGPASWIVDIARNPFLLLLLLLTVFGAVLCRLVLCLLKTSPSSNLDNRDARNDARGFARVLFDGEMRDSSFAFAPMASFRKEGCCAHFDSMTMK